MILPSSRGLPTRAKFRETWPRGRRHSPAKGASGPKPGSRVRIPPSPPVLRYRAVETPVLHGEPGFSLFVACSDCYANYVRVTRELVESRVATHLTRRGGVYYLCRSIPPNLIDGFGGDPCEHCGADLVAAEKQAKVLRLENRLARLRVGLERGRCPYLRGACLTYLRF